MATIKEIAELAGVSRGTVDRVLNGRGSVSEQTARKVLDIAQALQYRPNRAGIVLAAAVALHNLPVGLAIGTTVAAQGICYASILAAVTIGLHNIPEGMSIAIPLLHDGSRAAGAVGVAALSGIPTVIGAVLGYYVGLRNEAALAVALSVAGGAMLYVVFFELLPEAYRQWRSKWAILATILGFALGVLLIFGHVHVH